MNWRLVLWLGIPFGLVEALGCVVGWPAWVALPTTIAAIFIPAAVFARKGGRLFTNGFFTGMYIGLLQYGIVVVLWDRLSAYNANYAQFVTEYSADNSGIPLKPLITIGVALYAIFYGLLIGGLSWLLSKLIGPGKKTKAADSTCSQKSAC